MERAAVLQPIIDLYGSPRYLEIGVSHGLTFNALNARTKVAVDPHFQFAFSNSTDADQTIRYHQCTSDEFFADYGFGESFDVIYLDGLHTYEQTLRDLLNSVILLKPRGVIVIDDILPDSYAASMRNPHDCIALRQHTGDLSQSWMGDVFKVVLFIESFMQQFEYRSVAENHGQLVMWRQTRKSIEIPDRLLSGISNSSYADCVLQRDHFRIENYMSILAQVRSFLAAS